MLPTWAAVVIALGGAALGAASGALAAYLTLRSTQLGIRHQEREAWRARLIEAANQFVEAYLGAMNLLEEIRQAEDLDRGDEATRSITKANDAGILVGLLFGFESPPDLAGDEIVDALLECQAALEASRWDAASEAWEKAAKHQEQFISAAHAAFAPTT